MAERCGPAGYVSLKRTMSVHARTAPISVEIIEDCIEPMTELQVPLHSRVVPLD